MELDFDLWFLWLFRFHTECIDMDDRIFRAGKALYDISLQV